MPVLYPNQPDGGDIDPILTQLKGVMRRSVY